MALVKYVNGLDLRAIETPLLYVRSDRDTVIDMAAADNFYIGVASARREKIIVTNSNDPYGHVIAGDILSPDTTNQLAGQIAGFVRSLDNEVDQAPQR
jgi:esterase/lipase